MDENDCDFVNTRLRIDESISHTQMGQANITDTKNETSNDYVDMPQCYMELLVVHVKAMRKLRFEAKAQGKWNGGSELLVVCGHLRCRVAQSMLDFLYGSP